MKKILGLDIGTTSIGWAIVEAAEKNDKQKETDTVTDINNNRIGIHKDAVGVRIISQDTDNIKSFNEGKKLIEGSTLTPTANRRVKRGSRRMKSRYKLRRDKLSRILSSIGMDPAKEYYTNSKGKRGENNDIGKAIYELRDKAIIEKISLSEMGRILLHLNQWRGYSSDRFAKDEKPKFEYLTGVITSLSEKPIQIDYEKDDKTKINWLHYAVEIKLDDPYKVDEDNTISEIKNARIIIKEESNLTKKQGDIIAFNFKEQDIKEKNKKIGSFNKISLTKVNPEDWNYKYQTLQKTLTEWCEGFGTVGSYFYHNYYENQNIDRIRNNVVNREWYENEFDKIWNLQFENHKGYFEKINIEDVVKAAFKDFQPILNEVNNKAGIKEQLKFLIKDKIIFFQRPWQQAKSKGRCNFEKIKVKKEVVIKGTGNKEIIEEYIGRTVIPRSHPLYQEFKIWQQINNVRIFLNTPGEKIDLFSDADSFKTYIGKSIEEVKVILYNALQRGKTVSSWKSFAEKEFDLKNKKVIDDPETGEAIKISFTFNFRKQKKNGDFEDIKLKGNTTKVSLQNILKDTDGKWFAQFHCATNLKRKEKHEDEKKKDSCKEPITNLQLLWELIYDITNTDVKKVAGLIKKHFAFNDDVCLQLANIKFDDTGMGSLSAKAIRQILPLMSNSNNITEKAKAKINSLLNLNKSEEEKAKDIDEKLECIKGFVSDKKARLRLSKFNSFDDFKYLNYWEATAVVYGSHSTKNIKQTAEISRVKPHSMNNPIVEKIVNETISVVNEIYNRYGFDEVRIELSRELKASMEERQQMWEGMNSIAEKIEWAKQMLRELKNENTNLDVDTSNKSNIDKIRIIEDIVKFQKQDEYKAKSKEYKLGEPSKAEVKKYLLWLEQNFRCPYTNQPIPFIDVFARGKVVEIEHIIPRERYYLNSFANKVITWREVNQAKADNGNRTAFEFIDSKRSQNDKITLSDGKTVTLVKKEDWEEHVKSMFPKGGKRTNLLRKEIPEDPINRTLNETQYINKKLKEKLAELVGEQKVWVTSGAVTDILRDRWHLNSIMKELLRNRFENFEIPTGKKSFTLKTIAEQEKIVDEINQALNSESFEVFNIPYGKKFIEIRDIEELKKIAEELRNVIRDNIESPNKAKIYKYSSAELSYETKSLIHWTKQYNSKRNEVEDVEVFEGFSKRLDHRHHALDAIIIACTKQNHIQYINTLNAVNNADQENDSSKKRKYKSLKEEICIGDSSKKYHTPWANDKFIVDVKRAMNELVVAHKNTRLLISPSKHRICKDIKPIKNASIRGELHKETNYAKKNYFVGGNMPIIKLIPELLKMKMENQSQSMVHLKTFEEIIKETVLKEKYQNILIPLFSRYDDKILNIDLRKEISKTILEEIEANKLLINSKTNEPLIWLSTYAEKDKSNRPKGLSMDLNKEKEVKDIADPRIKKLAEYRLKYVNSKCAEIDKREDLGKKEKDEEKSKIKAIPLYSNAIYEVRVNRDKDKFDWIELKDFNWSDFDKIEYAKNETTQLIKKKLKEVDINEAKKTYFENPIFISQPILVKKVRQKAFFQDLYEVTKGRYVYSRDVFMTYFFIEESQTRKDAKRKCEFLKFIDAAKLISFEKPNQIDYSKLLNKTEHNLLFTLAKNDIVYLPANPLTHEKIEEIDWKKNNDVITKLYVVKDMEASKKKIVFQQLYKADSISLRETDAKSLFKNPELKEQKEEIKYGDVSMLQSCIKVYTDKLGKNIVPYWKFPNGCWNNEKAKELGLIL